MTLIDLSLPTLRRILRDTTRLIGSRSASATVLRRAIATKRTALRKKVPPCRK
jgi:hypothetical protein